MRSNPAPSRRLRGRACTDNLRSQGGRMYLLFAGTIFVGAALMFIIEPLFARMMLPLLGGSPAVWNTAIVFYQTVLLAGYGYVHWMTRQLPPRRQVWLHLTLLFVPLVVLPIVVPGGWTPPTQTNP